MKHSINPTTGIQFWDGIMPVVSENICYKYPAYLSSRLIFFKTASLLSDKSLVCELLLPELLNLNTETNSTKKPVPRENVVYVEFSCLLLDHLVGE